MNFRDISYLRAGTEKQQLAYKALTDQNGYRHMIIEHRLLKLMGPKAYEDIRILKKNGQKTEPAFGTYFNHEGYPYQVLLDIERKPDDVLLELIKSKAIA